MLLHNQFVFSTGLRVRNFLYRLQVLSIQQQLKERKKDQKIAYLRLRPQFEKLYKTLTGYEIEKFVTPWWDRFNKQLERKFLPFPPFSFLNNPIIMFTMFATSGGKLIREELAFIQRVMSMQKREKILEEDYIGNPLLYRSSLLTSQTAIHHLYHLARFTQVTKTSIQNLKTIVEWGGGYGSLAKIFLRLHEKSCTYIIIDTPFFCTLQWLYLSVVFGEKKVHVIKNSSSKIKPNMINIIPLGLLDMVNIKADLFISTWAISESASYADRKSVV